MSRLCFCGLKAARLGSCWAHLTKTLVPQRGGRRGAPANCWDVGGMASQNSAMGTLGSCSGRTPRPLSAKVPAAVPVPELAPRAARVSGCSCSGSTPRFRLSCSAVPSSNEGKELTYQKTENMAAAGAAGPPPSLPMRPNSEAGFRMPKETFLQRLSLAAPVVVAPAGATRHSNRCDSGSP